ncbi:type II secretion system protein [Hydrogenophaga sp.]|uniref:type II secretion system protein n=1 Tax=Hydrogenophaga sp. TaxID=1904254 RepID=UPI003F702D26
MRLRGREAGFSLLEMAMVLVIIGVVMSAVMVGTDVLRHAKGQKAFSVFISGWHGAFSEFTRVTRSLPRDATPPVNRILGNMPAGTPLCGANLTTAFMEASVSFPQGQGVGQQTSYIYQDSSGSPQVLQVCFVTLDWSVQIAPPPGVPVETAFFETRARHAMRIQGLTVELAMQMDVLIDGSLNARMGQFRLEGSQASLAEWNPGWGIPAADGNVQPVVTAYFEMF